MTKAPDRAKRLAKIHIAKAQLGLCDDTYRALLMTKFGVSSAAKLNLGQMDLLLSHFKTVGFKTHTAPNAGKEKQALISKIAALLADMHLSWQYAHALAKKMYAKDQVQWCNPEQLRGIITALVKKQSKLNQSQPENT